uniref:Bifunctional lysine-specific demethylase and histidyl-hydroxylase n=1 Tax=Alexandrium monilatum TaxID=311494 RepID=A0A7S4V6J5_9DINO
MAAAASAAGQRRCDECHEVSQLGHQGEFGTDYATNWYCERCWSSWEIDAVSAATEARKRRLRGQRASLVESLRCTTSGAVSVYGVPSLPPHWPRLLAVPQPKEDRSGGSSSSCSGSVGNLSGLLDSMHISTLAGALRRRILELWAEVLPRTPPATGAGAAAVEDFEGLFGAIVGSKSFKRFWVGPDRAPFVLPSLPSVRGALSLKDVVRGLAAAVGNGRRKPCETALTLTDGAEFRCPVGLPPVRTAAELREVLQFGTVFLNTASLHWRSLAIICLAASATLHFPTNINVYVTGPGRKISTDVHTDNHDVFVLHTEGAKHWKVYPPPARGPGLAHPLYRGKGEDRLLPSELAEPLLDVVLRPGEVLFVPMGFPHYTSTVDLAGAAAPGADAAAGAAPEISVHVTLGISTADYDFSLGGLRRALLAFLGEDAGLDEAGLPDSAYWRLLSPVPVGCLSPAATRRAPDPKAGLLQHIAGELRRALLAAEQERWEDIDEEQFRSASEQVIARHLVRQLTILESQEEGYLEVAGAPDGIFLARGPEESCSDFRRSMLEHQAVEDERKRRRAAPCDERFVRRVDPADGAARTKPELRELYGKRGFSPAQIDAYWDEQCKQVYPGDEPPRELVEELERAGESCEALLYFLRRRTPHLHTGREQATRRRPPPEQWIKVDEWDIVD